VQTDSVMGLIRSRTKPEDAKHVLGDVYVIQSKSGLDKSMTSVPGAGTLRLYLGYAGWDSGQLEWELSLDAWNVLPATASLVFDAHPETLWSRLVDQEDLQMARLLPGKLEKGL
jgi:putative transcriptional regulator